MNQAAPAQARPLGWAFLLIGLTVLAYLPSLHGGFIWDDDRFLTHNPLILSPGGLKAFWTTTAPADYWPLSSTSLWLEWRLWGMNPAGYHATNLLLHIAEVLLLWAILGRLRVPGAPLAALLFALHPVNVESVAWITQRKNLVAMLFYLVSIACFLRSDPARRRWYWLSLVSFVLALLGKGSVAPLPLVLLGLVAWRRKLRAEDGWRLAPFFAVAACFTATNLWFQAHHYTRFRTADFADRVVGAGEALWFYAGKAIWPARLSFLYPQEDIRAGRCVCWLPLLAAGAFTAWLWAIGRRGRSPWARAGLFAWLYFCVMLAPVLGFTDVGFMEFSLVADHYAHLALIAVAALAAAGVAVGLGRLVPTVRRAGWAACAFGVGLLAVLTAGQCRVYGNLQNLYTVALERNPRSWLAHFNLGVVLSYLPGRESDAIAQYEAALRLKPDFAEAHDDLGRALVILPDRRPEATAQFEETLRLDPNFADAHDNLGRILTTLPGRLPEATEHFEAAVRLSPANRQARQDLAEAYYNLANQLAGDPLDADQAIARYEASLRLMPDNARALNNAAVLYARSGRYDQAIAHWEAALRLDPGLNEVRENLEELRAMRR